MRNAWGIGTVVSFGLTLIGCASRTTSEERSAEPLYRILVTSENSGDVTIVDGGTLEVTGKIPVGKRPRGIHASADRRTVYVALSGSPAAPPGVDESTLPPPDKSADGVGIIDATQNKLVRTLHAGSDPEEFDISKDGKLLFVSNEDAGETSIVDLASGKVMDAFKVGEEPEGVKLTPDGRFVYVTSENDGTITVFNIADHKIVTKMNVG